MDPDAALAEMRDISKALTEAKDLNSDSLTDAARLAELVMGLDEWILRGGYLPEDWRKGR